MNKSALVERMLIYALRYAQADFKKESLKYISPEYVVVAMMKVADPNPFEKNLSFYDKSEYNKIRARFKMNAPFSISRQNLREELVKVGIPGKESENELKKIEKDAELIALSSGASCIDISSYLDAILLHPSFILSPYIREKASKKKSSFDAKAFKNFFSQSSDKKVMLNHLSDRVIGQEEAVVSFVEGVISSRLYGDQHISNRPKGIFVFAGPPGVGKTFLAECGAEELSLPVKRFDMSEFSTSGASVDFIGSDAVWKGAQKGQLTGFVEECNKKKTGCFLIFDEIEKAHQEVIQLFLQILDAGKLTDAYTRETVSFSEAFIVFTTNAGRSLYEDGKQPEKGLSKDVILEAMRRDTYPGTNTPLFPQAILSRMASGYVVMFRHLMVDSLITIAKKEMEKQAAFFESTYGTPISIDEKVPLLLLLQMGGETDARTFRAEAEKFIRNELFSLIDSVSEERLSKALGNKNEIQFIIDEEENSPIKSYFDISSEEEICIVSESKEQLKEISERLSVGENPLIIHGYSSYDEFLREYENGNIYTEKIFVMLPEVEVSKTSVFVTLSPLKSSVYQPFLTFLKEMSDELSGGGLYVFLDRGYFAGTNMISDLLKKGASDVIDLGLSDFDLSEKMLNTLQKLRLNEAVFKFSRERKALSFTTSPAVLSGEVSIRLRNFEISRRISGEDMNLMYSEDAQSVVRFEDIIGQEKVKEEVKEFISFLQNPKEYRRVSKEQPKGILLYGPPGTGKTYFAKALSTEAKVPFFPANGSQFVNQFAGSGPDAIRKLFEKARKYAPSIVFIDEIDSFAKTRGNSTSSQSNEETLNQLLSELDGFNVDERHPVFLVAATNASIEGSSGNVIDPALVRRFTRTIFVDLPSMADRLSYLKMQLSKYQISVPEEVLLSIAKRSYSMNFGNLKNVVEKARRDARNMNREVDADILDNALETIQFGEKKSWDESELLRTAWHEAGHAFMNWKAGLTPEYITITARGDFGGYVMPKVEEQKGSYTKSEIILKIKTALSGRAAEIVKFGKEDGLSTGPSEDFKQAGNLIYHYVYTYGMDEKSGLIVSAFEKPTDEIIQRMNELLNEFMGICIQEIEENRSLIEKFVDKLMENNKLMESEINEVFQSGTENK